MNIKRSLTAIFITLVLALASPWASAQAVLSPSLVMQSAASENTATTAAARLKAKPVKKRAVKSGNKNYSKATLSAFAPLQSTPGFTTLAPFERDAAAAIALSPVVQIELVEALDNTTPAAHAEIGANVLAFNTARPIYDEETSLVQHERLTKTAAFESNALGQESVSVIDRFSDKPKPQPIVSGPLRLRMKDSGLRASVRIPLSIE